MAFFPITHMIQFVASVARTIDKYTNFLTWTKPRSYSKRMKIGNSSYRQLTATENNSLITASTSIYWLILFIIINNCLAKYSRASIRCQGANVDTVDFQWTLPSLSNSALITRINSFIETLLERHIGCCAWIRFCSNQSNNQSGLWIHILIQCPNNIRR